MSLFLGAFFDLLQDAVVVCGIILAVLAYANALMAAKTGRLVVYCNWHDFLISSVWPITALLGLGWLLDSSTTLVLRAAGVVVIGFSAYSCYQMIAGAFRCNRNGRAWFALFARVFVTLLMFFALGKLHESIESYKRGRFGYGVTAFVRGVLVPLSVFAVIFNWLIRPMIGHGTMPRGDIRWPSMNFGIRGAVMNIRQSVVSSFESFKRKLPSFKRVSPEEYYSMGLNYCNGAGGKRDMHAAFVYFERAAKKGLRDAQFRVGRAYDVGNGVAENKFMAFKWYLKAAERGHARAQMCLGYAYRNGEGCDEDLRKAFKWYLKAADQNDAVAQNNLAMMYECGVGIAKDTEKARHWYKKAIENGNETASDNLKDMEAKLAKSAKSADGGGGEKLGLIDVPVSSGAACDVDLKSLVGLDPVKKAVSELRNFIAYKIECGKRGLPSAQISNHCVFTGNPGTGKTTVARIIAKLYHEMGLLKTAKVLEVDRSRVVGEYIGHTAKQMSKVIDEAMDGVLFIDEAYSLSEGGEKDFGREAVEVLLKRMDDNRDRLVVIVAGYTDEMHKFIDMNPGLKSRFTHYIEFPDYSAEELVRIFLSMCGKDGYICDDVVRKIVRAKMESAIEKRDRSFGNARFVRNFYEEAQRRIASRLAGKLSKLTDAELKTFDVKDFE